MIDFLKKHKALVIILTATVAVYANTLFHDYALDDTLVITHNEFTKKGISGIPEILSNDGFTGFFGHNKQLITGGRYRPMAQVFFAIEYQLFGANPFVGHLLNVLFYALSCGLVFVILSRLFPPRTTKYYFSLPFIATLIFALHPLHTEVVANIKGRDEIFSLLGALGALYFAIKHLEKPSKSTLAGVFFSFLFGLFSKENALTFFVIIPLTLFLFSPKNAQKWRQIRDITIILTIATIPFLIARYHALGFWIGGSVNNEILNDPYLYATSAQRLATVLFTWLLYFKLLVFPYPLTHDYYPHQIPILDFGDVRVWISLVITAFLLYYAFRNFKKNPIVSYGILFFFITFSMTSNLVLNVGTFMNERFVYASLLGFAIVIGYFGETFALKNSAKQTRSLAIILLIVFHVLGITSIKRNVAWKDDLTLFTTDVKTSTNSAKVNVSAGGKLTEYAETVSNNLEKQRLLTQAYPYLHKGVELHPKNHQAWFLLGNCCRALGVFDKKYYEEAYTAYNNALSVHPEMKEAQNNILFTAQQIKGENLYDVAKKFYLIAVKYYPQSAVWCDLAECYTKIGGIDSAEIILQKVLDSDPNNTSALNKKAEIFGMYKRDLASALKTLNSAYQADSTDLTTNENLGIVYGMMNNCERSIFHFKRALSKDSTNVRIRENLNRTYDICGIKN